MQKNLCIVFNLDSKHQKVEQKASTMSASTMSASTIGHIETLKHNSAVSKEHAIHSSKEHIKRFGASGSLA